MLVTNIFSFYHKVSFPIKNRNCHLSNINPLLHNPYFKQSLERSLLKTLWEKEKILVTSIFSFLSHNNPCFPCNIAITNFFILYTCEIRFYDVIDRTVHTFTSWRHPMQKFQNMAKWVFWTPIFNLIRLIQLCNKKNLTFVDCWDKILLNSSWKMLLSTPWARLITLSKTRLIKFYLSS